MRSLRYLGFVLLMLINACASEAQQFSRYPIRVTCQGDVKASIIGTVGPSAAANVMIEGTCGPAGSFFEIGPLPPVGP